jgi:hypothetical protein
MSRVRKCTWMPLCLAGLLCIPPGALLGGAEVADPDARLRTALNQELRERWGVELVALRLTAGGYMIDFRYRVVDPAKAAPIADLTKEAYLIDELTHEVHRVPCPPKVGSLRQSSGELKAGHIYFIIFGNTALNVRSGSEVAIVIGNFRAEHLVVQ